MNSELSINLDNKMKNIITKRIKSGLYKSPDEVVKAGLNILDDELNRIEALREEIAIGINSGIAYNFNPEEHLKSLQLKIQNG